MLSDSEVRCPGFFLNCYPLCQLKDFQDVIRLQLVITPRHLQSFSVIWYTNRPLCLLLVAFKKIYDLFLSFLDNFRLSKNGILQITRRVLGCKSGEFGFGYLTKHRN